jgi:hypothetical protein
MSSKLSGGCTARAKDERRRATANRTAGSVKNGLWALAGMI